MSYIRNFESFRSQKNSGKINEEILGSLFNWVKGFYNKAKAARNKTKGGKDVQAIYDKYLKIINDQLAKKANISLNLKGEEAMVKATAAGTTPIKTAESLLIKEAEDAAPVMSEEEEESKDTKLDAATLKSKMNIITQILDLQKKNARREMEAVLKKYGGAEKNPDLQILIDNKIREFDMATLNAEIEYLEKAGDKSAVQKLRAKRETVQKEIESEYKKIGTEASKEFKVGDKTLKMNAKYRYKSVDGIKTILVKGASDEEGKVEAAYVYGNTKDQVQKFTAANVETDFKPEKDKQYGYYSANNDRVINVTVTGDPDDKGMVDVKTSKAEFKVEVGALVDAEQEEGTENQ